MLIRPAESKTFKVVFKKRFGIERKGTEQVGGFLLKTASRLGDECVKFGDCVVGCSRNEPKNGLNFGRCQAPDTGCRLRIDG